VNTRKISWTEDTEEIAPVVTSFRPGTNHPFKTQGDISKLLGSQRNTHKSPTKKYPTRKRLNTDFTNDCSFEMTHKKKKVSYIKQHADFELVIFEEGKDLFDLEKS